MRSSREAKDMAVDQNEKVFTQKQKHILFIIIIIYQYYVLLFENH